MSPARRGPGGAGQESATARLTRLLAMVPWLLRRQGVDVEEAARHFEVSPRQIEEDLALLFVSGLPGGMPDDLIEAEWESGQVYLGNADTIARPLRLDADEASALLIGLRSLAAVPGVADPDLVADTIAVLEGAVGESAAALARSAARRIHVDAGSEAETRHVPALRDALQRQRRIHLTYTSATRDETTERDVDPMRLTHLEGHWYLEGWCHRSRDTRLFRLDRMEHLEVLDADGTPPPQARSRDLGQGLYRPEDAALHAELALAPEARWVLDYYPHDGARPGNDGEIHVTLGASDPDWVLRLVRRLGGHGRLLSPPDLVERLRDGTTAALAAYGEADVTNG